MGTRRRFCFNCARKWQGKASLGYAPLRRTTGALAAALFLGFLWGVLVARNNFLAERRLTAQWRGLYLRNLDRARVAEGEAEAAGFMVEGWTIESRRGAGRAEAAAPNPANLNVGNTPVPDRGYAEGLLSFIKKAYGKAYGDYRKPKRSAPVTAE